MKAVAPIRIADLGGWTDTWFAGHGAVCHIAVLPGVEVRVHTEPRGAAPQLTVHAVNLGEQTVVDDDPTWKARHPLLAAALAEATSADSTLADTLACHVTIASAIPPGASTGTSASLVVAMLAAFDRLAGHAIDREALARRAHDVEVTRLEQQSGVQDQIAASFGGINYIEIDSYPHATRTPVAMSHATRAALDQRLMLIHLGSAHASSAVHEAVIRSLRDGRGTAALQQLRDAARAGRDALAAGDLEAYGRALVANTDAQGQLHPALISQAAADVFALARAHGAAGWKVNGAGGEGGSVTILASARSDERHEFVSALEREMPTATRIAVSIASEGVTSSAI